MPGQVKVKAMNKLEIDTVAGDPFLKIEFKSTLSSKGTGLSENALFS